VDCIWLVFGNHHDSLPPVSSLAACPEPKLLMVSYLRGNEGTPAITRKMKALTTDWSRDAYPVYHEASGKQLRLCNIYGTVYLLGLPIRGFVEQ